MTDSTGGIVLVTGATGNVGRPLVNALLAAGHRVRALTRDPARADLPAGVEVVGGNLSDTAGLAAVFDGVRAAHLITFGDDYAPLANGVEIAALAGRAGVERVTVLKGDLGRSPLEEAIAASGLAWTGLAPVEFMSNTLEWAASIRAEGVVRAGFAGMPSTLVHDGDIAAVAAVALTENKSNKQRTEQGGGSGSEAAGGSGAGKGCGSGAGEGCGSGSEEGCGSSAGEAGGRGSEEGGGSGSEEAGGGRGSGREYWLTGPEALTPPEQVAIIAAVLGREVRFVELSRDEVVAGWRADGYGPEDIEFFLAMRTDPPAAGYTVLPTVEDVLGRPARTLRTWVAENRSAFD